MLSGSQLTFQLGGLTQGSQYGFISVNGAVTLGGNLVLSFANGFQNSVTGANTFTLMTTTGTLTGAFANVVSGGTLVVGTFGTFVVTYGGGTLTLSGFVPSSGAVAALWDGSNNNWSSATHWSSNPAFPNGNFNVTVNGGTIGLDGNYTVNTLTMTGGTVSGVNTLTVGGLFTSSAGHAGRWWNVYGKWRGHDQWSGRDYRADAYGCQHDIGQSSGSDGDAERGQSNLWQCAVFNNLGTYNALNNGGNIRLLQPPPAR